MHELGDRVGRRAPTMVFAGSFWNGGTERGLADGFREGGWAVQEIDSRDYRIGPGHHLSLRIAARLLRNTAEEAYRRRIVDACRLLKPDIFLTVKGAGVSGELLRCIKKADVRTAMFYPDFHFDYRGVSADTFAEYDLFITTKTFQLDYLNGRRGLKHVAYVPHGYVDAVHRPPFTHVAEDRYCTDLLYSGSYSTFKHRWLEKTIALLPEVSMDIVGARWHQHKSGSLLRHRTSGAQIGPAYAAAIQRSRINLAIHMGPTSSGWEDLVSTRTFEIPACGGFMLHIDNDEVREFFKPGEEIDVFSTPEELADKIRFYLARPTLRAQMIERAHARAVPAYGYRARSAAVDELLRAEPLPSGYGVERST